MYDICLKVVLFFFKIFQTFFIAGGPSSVSYNLISSWHGLQPKFNILYRSAGGKRRGTLNFYSGLSETHVSMCVATATSSPFWLVIWISACDLLYVRSNTSTVYRTVMVSSINTGLMNRMRSYPSETGVPKF